MSVYLRLIILNDRVKVPRLITKNFNLVPRNDYQQVSALRQDQDRSLEDCKDD
jgi:hypothetical protein